jgi:hypothetical protein
MTKHFNWVQYAVVCMIAFATAGCDRCTHAVKQGINKTGQVVGSTAAEAGKGIYEGAAKEFECTVDVSDNLKKQGLSIGKFEKTADSAYKSGNYNVLHVYIITDKDIDAILMARVLDHNHKEYGRTRIHLTGKAGNALWVDFIFDRRTDFENNSVFVIEQVSI